MIDIVGEEGELHRVAEAAAEPTKQPLVEALRRFPSSLHHESPAHRALRTGRPVVLDRFDEGALETITDDDEHKALVRQIGPTSVVSVPVTARGRVMAVITFGMAESGRMHSQDDVEFAERLARQAGQALDGSRLVAAERRARQQVEETAHRLERLGRLTAALSEALTPQEVATAVLRHGLHAIGAQAGVVSEMDASGTALELLAARGHPAGTWDEYGRIPLERPVPMAQAARTKQAVQVSNREQWSRDFPDAPRMRTTTQGMIILPLVLRGHVVGVLGMSLDAPDALHEMDRTLMAAIADQCAQALERARLYDAERRARREAEAAHGRLLLLAEAQQQFVESAHDYEAAIRAVAKELSHVIGDSCWVRMLSADGQWLETPLVYHPEQALADALQHIVQSIPQRADHGIAAEILTSGRAVLLPVLTPDLVRERVAPEYREYVDRYPLYSIMGAVLRGRGEAFGVLQMARHTPDRPYQEDDLVLLEQLAQRAGVAIHKARLLENERRARAEAEQALRTRDEFLAVVTHDLRAPLNTISMAATLIDETPGIDTDLRRQVGAIHRATASMDRLIGDLVELARLEGGRLTLARGAHAVEAMVNEVVELFRTQAEERGIRLETISDDAHVRVRCDRHRIVQVLSNLVSNAIKFSPPGGVVRVTVSRAGDGVEVAVVDSGPGIPDESRERIFDRYWTAEGSDQGTGVGLGLAIVKGLLEAHGAPIRVSNTDEHGARFSFQLPADPADLADQDA